MKIRTKINEVDTKEKIYIYKRSADLKAGSLKR